jgi:hypothetical protein
MVGAQTWLLMPDNHRNLRDLSAEREVDAAAHTRSTYGPGGASKGLRPQTAGTDLLGTRY